MLSVRGQVGFGPKLKKRKHTHTNKYASLLENMRPDWKNCIVLLDFRCFYVLDMPDLILSSIWPLKSNVCSNKYLYIVYPVICVSFYIILAVFFFFFRIGR